MIPDHQFRYELPDCAARKVYRIYSRKSLNQSEITEAILDAPRHVSTTRRIHPEYGILYEFVDIHFCARIA